MSRVVSDEREIDAGDDSVNECVGDHGLNYTVPYIRNLIGGLFGAKSAGSAEFVIVPTIEYLARARVGATVRCSGSTASSIRSSCAPLPAD